jgi:putative flippase GtrA
MFKKLINLIIDRLRTEKVTQFIKFCVVGVSNTIVSLIVYYLIIFINNELYIIGNIAGFIAGVSNSYFWNSRFVFLHKDDNIPKRKEPLLFIKTIVAYGSTLILGTVFMWILIEKIGVSEYLAPICNIFLTTPINFLLNKLWVYKIKEI